MRRQREIQFYRGNFPDTGIPPNRAFRKFWFMSVNNPAMLRDT